MTKQVVIDGRVIGDNQPPFVIAELSANHNGSLARALMAIEKAHQCGANAVKLQTYTPETMTIDCAEPDFIINGGLWDGYKLYDLYKWAHTPFEWHEKLFSHAKKVGVTLFSTPFDESAVELLESLGTPAYKIASFENTDLPLIECVARTGKPLIISTGLATEAEIREAVDTARHAGCSQLVLLHCVSSYPTPLEEANVTRIPDIAREFDVLAGLSDHTLGIAASVAGVALGATVIEKHFTLSRADKGPDSDFSLEPEELRELCDQALSAWKARGYRGFGRQPAEEQSHVFRRSIYFVKDLPAGSVITERDIRRIRPGMGLAPKYFKELIGKRLRTSVKRGSPAHWDHFDESSDAQ